MKKKKKAEKKKKSKDAAPPSRMPMPAPFTFASAREAHAFYAKHADALDAGERRSLAELARYVEACRAAPLDAEESADALLCRLGGDPTVHPLATPALRRLASKTTTLRRQEFLAYLSRLVGHARLVACMGRGPGAPARVCEARPLVVALQAHLARMACGRVEFRQRHLCMARVLQRELPSFLARTVVERESEAARMITSLLATPAMPFAEALARVRAMDRLTPHYAFEQTSQLRSVALAMHRTFVMRANDCLAGAWALACDLPNDARPPRDPPPRAEKRARRS